MYPLRCRFRCGKNCFTMRMGAARLISISRVMSLGSSARGFKLVAQNAQQLRRMIHDLLRLTRARGKPRPSGAGKDSADSESVVKSVRSFLLLDVLAHDADRRSAAGGSEVTWRPEHTLPVTLADVRALLA